MKNRVRFLSITLSLLTLTLCLFPFRPTLAANGQEVEGPVPSADISKPCCQDSASIACSTQVRPPVRHPGSAEYQQRTPGPRSMKTGLIKRDLFSVSSLLVLLSFIPGCTLPQQAEVGFKRQLSFLEPPVLAKRVKMTLAVTRASATAAYTDYQGR